MGSETRKLVFKDKNLLVFPLVSSVVGVAEFAAIFGSVYVFGGLSLWAYLAGLVVFYPIVFFTSTYVLMAMLLAFRRFGGGERIGMKEAFAGVRPYTKLIIQWALFQTIVLLAIRLMQSFLGRVGGLIFGALASATLTYATLFAVPIILNKKTGPIQTVKEGTQFVTRNFGQTFGGVIFSDLYSAIFIVPGILIIFGGLVGGVLLRSLVLLWLLLSAGVILVVFGLLLSYTLVNVLKLIIYDHVNGVPLPAGFREEIFSVSIRRKKLGRGLFGFLRTQTQSRD